MEKNFMQILEVQLKRIDIIRILKDVKYFFDEYKGNWYVGKYSAINISMGNFPNSTYKQPFLEILINRLQYIIYHELSFIVNMDLSLKHENVFMLYNA